MNIIIQDDAALYKVLEKQGLRLGANIKEICLALFNDAETAAEDITIKIHQHLIQSSYLNVPAMFASYLKRSPDCVFAYVRAFLRGSYLVIVASQNPIAVTFRGKLMLALKEDGRYVCKRKAIPLSYRSRPNLLATTLGRSLGITVKCDTLGGKVRWKKVS